MITTKSGFSTIEVLIVLSIITMLSLFTLPYWQGLSAEGKLKMEARQLMVFLQELRQLADEHNSRWVIELRANNGSKSSAKWYIYATEKNSKNLMQIQRKQYLPLFSQTQVSSPASLPKVITTFDGVRGGTKSSNLTLKIQQFCVKFVFSNTIYIRTEYSQC